ncbi:hypothetical protein [Terrisporobacter sp.]
MKSSYKFYTSEAEITYKTTGNKELMKLQKSNRTGIIVYSISLPIIHAYSMYSYYQHREKIIHSINIKNNSTIILHDVHIVISIKDKMTYNLEFLGVNKPSNYYRSKNFINIKVKSLIPNEELYIKLTGYPYYIYNFREIGEIQLNSKVMGIDGNVFTVEKIEKLNL